MPKWVCQRKNQRTLKTNQVSSERDAYGILISAYKGIYKIREKRGKRVLCYYFSSAETGDDKGWHERKPERMCQQWAVGSGCWLLKSEEDKCKGKACEKNCLCVCV